MPINTLTTKQAVDWFSPAGMGEKMKAAALRGLYSAALRAKRDLQTRAMTDLGKEAPIDRRIYVAGWQTEKMPDGAVIYNAVPHAVFIEYGVPAANVVASFKGQQAIAEWARRKLGGISEKKAWQVAGAILASMRMKGIFKRGQGLRVLERYVKASLPVVVNEEIAREIKKVKP